MKYSPLTLSAIIASTLFTTTGCIIHVNAHEDNKPNKHQQQRHNNNHDSVFGGIDIDTKQNVGHLTSVNGGIDLADGVTAQKVETVNGGIELGKDVKIKSASTVNGGIGAEQNLTVENDVSTVNGGISLDSDSRIGGNVSTVNGNIHLANTLIAKDIKTKNGDIKVLNHSTIEGNIIYSSENQNSWWKDHESSLPTLTIDSSSQIKGRIILERKVRLEIEDDELLAKIEHRYTK